MFWLLLNDNPLTDGFRTKVSILFFEVNEIRDEAKTWWLFFGPDVA